MEVWEIFKFDLLSTRKKWVSLKENLTKNNLKQQYTSTEWALKQICPTINCEEYPTISSFAKITYIIPVSNAWPERSGSAIKRIKKNKRSTLKNNALNALLMLSLNGPQIGEIEAKELIKHTARIYGERQQYKKVASIKQREQETDSKHTYVILCVESEFMENVEECLDVITPDRKIRHFKF